MKRIAWVIVYLLLLSVLSLIIYNDSEIIGPRLTRLVANIPSYLERLVTPWKEIEVAVSTSPKFVLPVNGDVLSSYGWQRHPLTKLPYYHRAIDFVAEIGTPVRAIQQGQVSKIYYSATLGETVIIQHSQGWSSGYAHLGQVLVGEGDFVATGTVIARSGTSGLLRLGTEPHLHLMLFLQDVPVDPMAYLASEPPGRNLQ